MAAVEFLALVEDDGAAQGVFQLAHVARPIVGQQRLLRAGAQAGEMLAFVAGHATQ